jgi:phosphate-selective porin OprO and OprP
MPIYMIDILERRHVLRTYCRLAAILIFAASLTAAQSISDSAPAEMVAASTDAQSSRPVSFGSNGLLFSTQDKAFQLRVHGYIQADDRYFTSNVHGEELDTFFFRKIRPLFEGTLFNAVDFRFMPDFGQNNPQIQEAFLELKTIPFAKLRVGKFKEPVGLEVLRSDRELTFVERSLVSDLVPLRYIGAQVGGSILSKTITYSVGYFNGSNDGSNGNFQWLQSNELAARVFVQPFATAGMTPLQNFGVGVGSSEGDQHGSIAGLKSTGLSTFFKYSSSARANGQHNRISPQAYYYWGPVGLLSEYALSSQDVLNKSVTRRLKNEAWQVAGSVVLTGERNTYDGIRPRHAFEPYKHLSHLGALELSARYSHLQLDRDAFPLFANPKTAAQQAGERVIGLTWYLDRYAKLLLDYEHTRFGMAASNLTPLHSENVLMSRIQLAF